MNSFYSHTESLKKALAKSAARAAAFSPHAMAALLRGGAKRKSNEKRNEKKS